MKVLTKKDQGFLSQLFKELLKRKWKESHIATSLVEESMKVMTYSFNKTLTKKDKKEIFDVSYSLAKEILLYYFKKKEYLNPIVVLASPNALHLCEIPYNLNRDVSKFSLIGKYAKKYKCTSAVFVTMSHSYHVKNLAAYIISLAYDESLCFTHGKDMSIVFCMPLFKNTKVETKFLNLPYDCPLTDIIIDKMRKPIGRIIPLNSVSLN